TFQNHTNRPLTDFGGKTSIFSHPVYLYLREFSLQDFRSGSAINDELYLSISKLQEHAALVYKIFCISESNDARECAAPGAVACRDCGETNA
ncbi:hypothetical protein ACP65_26470, partial [Escherichia coli]